MKKLFATLSAILFVSFASHAQVVINEIFYNAPGTDLEEFIELHNVGSTPVDLQNYTFTQGVTHTFAGGTIPAGGYFIIAKDSTDFHNAFGMAPDAEWTGGALSNGGEDITLYDSNGAFVDSVDYSDVAPWPTNADGGGQSLQLCDPGTDNNDAANWGTSNIGTGFSNNGVDSIYATPGAINSCVAVVPPPPPSYPVYTFDIINNVNSNGTADSLNVTCELRGIAHCIDFRGGSGLDFNFANSNNTGGIRVFSLNDVNNYTVTGGDSLHIWGKVSQYNGLLQFTPDSIAVISQGNTTATPVVVTQLSETTENRFVTFIGMHLVDTAEWTGTGSGFNVRATDGSTDTILVRIDNDADLYSQPAPLGTFSISGWGGQFDPTIPRNSGYQLSPCNMTMITGTTKLENNSSSIAIYPNPVSTSLTIQSDVEIENILVHNTLGQAVINLNNINSNITQVATNNLENGVYIISIISDGKIMTQQFQVMK